MSAILIMLRPASSLNSTWEESNSLVNAVPAPRFFSMVLITGAVILTAPTFSNYHVCTFSVYLLKAQGRRIIDQLFRSARLSITPIDCADERVDHLSRRVLPCPATNPQRKPEPHKSMTRSRSNLTLVKAGPPGP